MILKEQNNQKKTLKDGVLDVNRKQENTRSTNGKASPWAFSLSSPSSICPQCACSTVSQLLSSPASSLSVVSAVPSSRSRKSALVLPSSWKSFTS